MKQQSLSISIPEPCHENWSEMTSVEKGRHCLSCQKTVIDFTRMPKVQIAEVISNQSGSTCGRFFSDQLNVELMPPKPSKSWMKYAAIFMGLIPALGYGQEVPVPDGRIQVIQMPEITGEIIIEKTEEFSIQSQSINKQAIEGKIIFKYTKSTVPHAMLEIMVGNNTVNTLFTDANGNFKAIIPEGAYIKISDPKLHSKIIKYAEISINRTLIIEVEDNSEMEMGIVVIPPDKEPIQLTKGKIKINSKTRSRKIVSTQKTQNITANEIKSENQKFIKYDSRIVMGFIKSNPEEPMQHLFPTVEIVALRPTVSKCLLVGSSVIIDEEVKESWLKRLWKRFNNFIKESLSKAQSEKIKYQTSSLNNPSIESKHTPIENITTIEKTKSETERINIKVYPNPTSGYVNINIPDHIHNFKLNISNMQNELVYSKDHFTHPKSIDLSSFISATYIISIVYQEKLIYSEILVKI